MINICIHVNISRHIRHRYKLPKKLVGCVVFDPAYILFQMICTINSELNNFPMFTHLSDPGLTSAGFQWTGSTPNGFQEAFRAV